MFFHFLLFAFPVFLHLIKLATSVSKLTNLVKYHWSLNALLTATSARISVISFQLTRATTIDQIITFTTLLLFVPVNRHDLLGHLQQSLNLPIMAKRFSKLQGVSHLFYFGLAVVFCGTLCLVYVPLFVRGLNLLLDSLQTSVNIEADRLAAVLR